MEKWRQQTRARGGRESKRRDILAAACVVFAGQGYARTSIDAIAASAEVSTRTIYNHFDNKAALFEAVIRYTTTEVAEAQIAIIESKLQEIRDLEDDLIEFGLALATPMTRFADHFALIRQIDADAGNVPQAALDAWRSSGPERVISALTRQMKELADQGLLKVDDPERAATHFMLLVRGAVPFHHGIGATPKDEVAENVASGVRVFLRGYQP